jgi:two-component system, sensor histidine kinase LadS
MKTRNICILICVFAIIAAFTGSAHARVVTLGDRESYIVKFEILRDPQGTLPFSRVRDSAKFEENDTTNFGYVTDIMWTRFTVSIPADNKTEWFMEIGYPLLNKIDVYFPELNHNYTVSHYGNKLPFNKRYIPYHNFVIHLNSKPGTYTYYIRFEHQGSMIIPMTIFSLQKVVANISFHKTIFGLFYGALLIIFLYNVFIAFYMKDIIYVSYFLFIFSMIMLSLGLTGYGFQFVWPTATWMNKLLPFWMILSEVTFGIFTLLYLNYHDVHKNHFYSLVIFLLIVVILLFASLFIPYHLGIMIAGASYVPGISLVILAVTQMIRKRQRKAIIYSVAFSFLLAGVVISLTNRFGVLPDYFFILWCYQFGLVISIVFFSFGLADKVIVLKNGLEKMNIELEEKVKVRTNELEIRTNELKGANVKLKEIDRLKNDFFANISHEIRTPLTLMLAPIEAVLEGNYGHEPDHGFFEMLSRNGLQLLGLVNNFLDFSKLENGSMAMEVQCADMVKLIRDHAAVVHSVCDLKGICIDVVSEAETIMLYMDPEKMDRVVSNLFSNAIKFTDKGGSIRVSIKEDERQCLVGFEDTGSGIPPDKISSIFDRFTQADSGPSRRFGGTGIGLALVREFLALHGGSISVVSRYFRDYPVDHGTVFNIIIPKGSTHLECRDGVVFSDDDASPVPAADLYADVYVPDDSSNDFDLSGHAGEADHDSCSRILIVEDNPDMHRLLQGILGAGYQLLKANNGREAIDLLLGLDEPPDLILSDVMMPEMDGYELTRRLRSDSRYEGVPIILLTAKIEEAMKLEGFEKGATDYVTKPFNARELVARIRAQLELKGLRDRLRLANRHMYRRLEEVARANERIPNTAIEQKVQWVVEFIKGNYTADISREGLAAAVGMSPNYLSKMFNQINDMRIDEYINKLRIETAAQQLVQNSDYSVTFIAMESGFASLRQFNRVFYKVYGMTPTEYRSGIN